jgi:hypothetical protein
METLASGIAAPANADNTAQVDSGEADANLEKANGDGSAPSVPEADTPAPKKDAVQERIDKLTRDKYDNARLADQRGYALERETAENRRLSAELAELKKAQTTQVAPGKRPTLEQFGFDQEKFDAAIDAYNDARAEAAKEDARAAAREVIEAEREATRTEQANKSWKTKESEFLKSKPDYAQKVYRDPQYGGPIITKEMGEIMLASEYGPAIAYHLADNVEKAALIAQMSPMDQAREIGKIEAKLELAKAPPKPAVSQAPPPVNKVDSADAQAEKSPAEMTDKEFDRWRKKQIAARRNQ